MAGALGFEECVEPGDDFNGLAADAGRRRGRYIGPRSTPDGDNLLPVLAGIEPPRERTIFWRYKGGDQAAVRQANWKYLRRGETEFLYDLATDPRERANLKGKAPEVFSRLRDAHSAWNGTMLAYPPESFSATDD